MTSAAPDLSGIASDPLLLSAMAALSEPGFRPGWVDPSKQSVAVLPFLNMSGDIEQEYFADGLTEDVITELARFKNLFVISRNSSFHFKGKALKVQDVGRELSAQYVVEGSVRKSGNRVRVTSQLVETANGSHLWAERYDRDLTDIFKMQDELVQAIASAIPGALDRQALDQARRKPPENLTAYECELRGRWAYNHWSEGLEQAIKWFERAVEADPNYATALALLAGSYNYSALILGAPVEEAVSKARNLIEKALALDDRNATVHGQAAYIYLGASNIELARRHAERAYMLNSNEPLTAQLKAIVLCYSGLPGEALEWFVKSEKLEPYAQDDQRLDGLCDAYYMLKQYDKVVQVHRVYRNAPPGILVVLAAALAQLGRVDEARRVYADFDRRRRPEHDVRRSIAAHMMYCAGPEDRDHWLDGFRKAGIPV